MPQGYYGDFGHEAEGEGDFEADFEAESFGENEQESGEMEQMQLAAELMEVSNEQEMEQFLGDLISKAGKVVSGIAHSSVGKALGGVLKSAAKTVLPMAGKAIGGYFGGSTGADLGGQLASAAGKAFGLELEGLSGEDRDFEVSKQFVKFADAATKHAARATQRAGGPRYVTPALARKIAKSAVLQAARQHAPGLVKVVAAIPTAPKPAGPVSAPPAPRPSAPSAPSAPSFGGFAPPSPSSGGFAPLPPLPQTPPPHFSPAPLPPAPVGIPSGPTAFATTYAAPSGPSIPGQSGRWFRRGRKVYLTGL